jgi:hypothetical protein
LKMRDCGAEGCGQVSRRIWDQELPFFRV